MNLADILPYLQPQLLLALGFACMALVLAGGILRESMPFAGGLMRFAGHITLGGALIITILQLFQVGQFRASAQGPTPAQAVTGDETRVPIDDDGHFWVDAEVNGIHRRFLVDTGATLTTLTPATAEEAGVAPRPDGRKVILNTANGSSTGAIAAIERLRVGNVVARKLEAVVAPGVGDTNVLGMNFLSSLTSWRVEGKTMILVPNAPQVAEDDRHPGE